MCVGPSVGLSFWSSQPHYSMLMGVHFTVAFTHMLYSMKLLLKALVLYCHVALVILVNWYRLCTDQING